MCGGRSGQASMTWTKSESEVVSAADCKRAASAASDAPKVLSDMGLGSVTFRLLTGLFQVRVLVGELT